jgi:hypothetical protein
VNANFSTSTPRRIHYSITDLALKVTVRILCLIALVRLVREQLVVVRGSRVSGQLFTVVALLVQVLLCLKTLHMHDFRGVRLFN